MPSRWFLQDVAALTLETLVLGPTGVHEVDAGVLVVLPRSSPGMMAAATVKPLKFGET